MRPADSFRRLDSPSPDSSTSRFIFLRSATIEYPSGVPSGPSTFENLLPSHATWLPFLRYSVYVQTCDLRASSGFSPCIGNAPNSVRAELYEPLITASTSPSFNNSIQRRQGARTKTGSMPMSFAARRISSTVTPGFSANVSVPLPRYVGYRSLSSAANFIFICAEAAFSPSPRPATTTKSPITLLLTFNIAALPSQSLGQRLRQNG